MSLVHYEDRDRVDKLLGARLKGPFEMKFRIVRPDGEVQFIHQVSEYVLMKMKILYICMGNTGHN